MQVLLSMWAYIQSTTKILGDESRLFGSRYASMSFAKMTINPVIYQYSKEIATKQIYTVQYSDTLCATIDDTF